MIRCCFSFVEGFSTLLNDVVELRPKFQPITLRFIHTFILRNTHYCFYKVVWLLDDFKLRSWLRITYSVSVNLNQEKRNAVIRMFVKPFNRACMLITSRSNYPYYN